MGILNSTPDSFSDGGKFNKFSFAKKQIEYLFQSGAEIVDIGGESTRPGAKSISPKTEWSRIKHVLKNGLDIDIRPGHTKGSNYEYLIDSKINLLIGHPQVRPIESKFEKTKFLNSYCHFLKQRNANKDSKFLECKKLISSGPKIISMKSVRKIYEIK